MFRGKGGAGSAGGPTGHARAPSRRNPAIPEELINENLASIIYYQRTFEEAAAQLVKVSKRYEETIAELSRARLKLREELLSLPLFVTRKDDTNPEKQNFDVRIDQFRRLTDLLVERGKDLRENYQGTVHEPVRKYMKMFPAINEKVKHHERCALDYVKAQEKYDKVLKSGSGDQSKRDKAMHQCDQARVTWEQANDVLPEELPLIYEARLRFLDPLAASLLASHIKYLEAIVDNMATICLEEEVRMSDEDYRRQIDQIFEDLSKLSITGE